MSKPIEQFVTDQQYVDPGSYPYNLGEYDEEGTTPDRLLDIHLDRSDFWLQETSLGKAGRYEDVIASYDRAIAINPGNSDAWYFRGVVLGKDGRYDESIVSYGKAVAINPNNSKAWYYRGAALSKVGRDEEAISSYGRVVAINPDNADAWYYRGTALSKVGRDEEAISSYGRAISLKPQDFRAYYNRGRLKEELNDLAGAMEDFNQALALKPKFAIAYINCGFLRRSKINDKLLTVASFRQKDKPGISSIHNWRSPLMQAQLSFLGQAKLSTNSVYEIQHTGPLGNRAICSTGFHTQDKRWRSV